MRALTCAGCSQPGHPGQGSWEAGVFSGGGFGALRPPAWLRRRAPRASVREADRAPGGPRDMWQARRAGSPRSLAPHPDLPRSSRLPPPRCASGPSPVTWGQCRTRLRECLWAYGRDSPVTPAVLEHRKWRPLLSRPQLLLSRPSQLLDGAGALSFTSPPVHRLRWRSRSERFVPKQCCGFLESSSR